MPSSVAPVTAAPAPQAVRDGAASPGEGAVASFLNQLQAALGSLGLLPQPQAPAQPLTEGAPSLPVAAATDEDTAATDSTPDTSDAMAEMLAALGFLPVPATLPTLVTAVQQPAKDAASALTATLPQASQAGPLAPLAPLAPTEPTAPTAPTGPPTPLESGAAHGQPLAELTQQAPIAEPVQDQSMAQQPTQTDTTAQRSQAAPVDTSATDQAAQQAQQPINAAAMLTQLTPITPQRVDTSAPGQVREHHSAAPGAVDSAAATTTPVLAQPLASSLQQQAGDSSTSDSNGDADMSTTAQPVDSSNNAAGASFGVAVANAVAERPQPTNEATPAHVVGQIAHQADLYRLPGGRGVRIQLHPDDLGGVGVTIKYGATGGLELHVTTEHAATAELVQGGWSDLRNALSLQGISPDRLVMSVSGPGNAGLSDNSSNGGNRSDAGQTTFGQTSQQERPRDEARSNRGSGTSFAVAPISATDDAPQARSASSSRIDYQA